MSSMSVSQSKTSSARRVTSEPTNPRMEMGSGGNGHGVRITNSARKKK